jgi:hypothetical protein
MHIERSPDSNVPIGTLTLPGLTVANEVVLAKTTASIALLTLRSVCRFAVRRGWMSVYPVTLLEASEKPRWRPGSGGSPSVAAMVSAG